MAGKVWSISTRRGIAYVEGRDCAERVLEALGRLAAPRRGTAGVGDSLLLGAMAVYTDRKGRPFAWLVSFDLTERERVVAAGELTTN